MTKSLAREGFNTVVIRTWLVDGPGGDVDHPRWRSSYSIGGATAVEMKGEGVEDMDGAALVAVNAVQGILFRSEWARLFALEIYKISGDDTEMQYLARQGPHNAMTQSHRAAADVAKEEFAKAKSAP